MTLKLELLPAELFLAIMGCEDEHERGVLLAQMFAALPEVERVAAIAGAWEEHRELLSASIATYRREVDDIVTTEEMLRKLFASLPEQNDEARAAVERVIAKLKHKGDVVGPGFLIRGVRG